MFAIQSSFSKTILVLLAVGAAYAGTLLLLLAAAAVSGPWSALLRAFLGGLSLAAFYFLLVLAVFAALGRHFSGAIAAAALAAIAGVLFTRALMATASQGLARISIPMHRICGNPKRKTLRTAKSTTLSKTACA